MQSNCLHSSSHLSLFISPFSRLLIHQAIIISLSLQSHPSLSQSLIPSPCLYSVSIFPSYDTISISCIGLSFSLLFFSPKHCCQQPVISQCVFCCELLCPTPLLQCHPVGALPHWLLLEGAGTEDERMYEICTFTLGLLG